MIIKSKKEIIEEVLKDSEKPFNSIHIKYPTKNPNAKSEPVSELELIEALNKLKYLNL